MADHPSDDSRAQAVPRHTAAALSSRAFRARVPLQMNHATPTPAWLRLAAETLSVLAVAGLGLRAALVDLPTPSAPGGTLLQPSAFDSCGGGAYLRGRLHGALAWTIDWSDQAMRCDGMLRPEAAGLRLIFAPTVIGDGPLLVIGLEGRPEHLPGQEVAANLTIIDEGNGRFFNSGDGERCWALVSRVDLAAGDYEIAGKLYCAGALAEVNGPGTVTPGEFEFAGRIPKDPE